MKIGFFTDSYLPSPDGVATTVEATTKELQKLGHEVFIIAPDQPHSKDRKGVIRLVSVRVMKSPDIWWALEVPQPALFKIGNLEFDIIHGHSGGPISFLGWQLAYLHNIPFIETYHTSWKNYRHYFPYPELFKVGVIKKLTAFFNNDCDAVITPSVKTKNELLHDGVTKPIYVVPSGIFPEKFANQKKGYLHEKLAIPSDKKIALTVGRLHKEKSIDFLIKAFALAMRTRTDTVFVIIGDGQKKDELHQLATSLGIADHVYFAGAVAYNAMPKIYADADLFIFASQSETQGMVIYEAFASGLPVLAVEDVVFETVIKNGKNGFVVKKDITVFAHKLTDLLNNHPLRSKLSRQGIESAKEFSVTFTTRVLEQVYQEVIFQRALHAGIRTPKQKAVLSLLGIKKHITSDFKTLQELLESIK